jgi:hypothetical protein
MNRLRVPGWMGGAFLAASGTLLRQPSFAALAGFACGLAAASGVRHLSPRLTRALLAAAAAVVVVAVFVSPFGLEGVLARGFAPADGLFYWNPVLWLGVAGLLVASGRGSAAAGLLAAASGIWTPPQSPSTAFVAGAVAALFGPAIAAVLEFARAHAARQPLLWLSGAAFLLAVWNFAFMEQYRRVLIPRDDTVSFVDVARNNAALVSSVIGAPTTWPASWPFALRHHVEPGRYEAVSQQPARLLGTDSDVLDLASPAIEPLLVGGGWSTVKTCGVSLCRGLEGPSRVLVRLGPASDLELGLQAWGTAALDLDVNGARVASVPLLPDGGEARIRVVRAQWHVGLNELRFTPSAGAAAIGRLTLRTMGAGG